MNNKELIRVCANELELTTSGLSYPFQVELLRRFMLVASPDEHPTPLDPYTRTRDLFSK